jgi:hypothetical protein
VSAVVIRGKLGGRAKGPEAAGGLPWPGFVLSRRPIDPRLPVGAA